MFGVARLMRQRWMMEIKGKKSNLEDFSISHHQPFPGIFSLAPGWARRLVWVQAGGKNIHKFNVYSTSCNFPPQLLSKINFSKIGRRSR